MSVWSCDRWLCFVSVCLLCLSEYVQCNYLFILLFRLTYTNAYTQPEVAMSFLRAQSVAHPDKLSQIPLKTEFKVSVLTLSFILAFWHLSTRAPTTYAHATAHAHARTNTRTHAHAHAHAKKIQIYMHTYVLVLAYICVCACVCNYLFILHVRVCVCL